MLRLAARLTLGLATVLCTAGAALAVPIEEHPGMRLRPDPHFVYARYTYEHPADMDPHCRPRPGAAPVCLQSRLDAVNVSLEIPAWWFRRGFVFAGAEYDMSFFRVNGGESVYRDGRIYVHRLGVVLGATVAVSDRWLVTARVVPHLASDLAAVGRDDLWLDGSAVVSWALSDHTALLFGGAASRKLGRFVPYPVLGLVYRPRHFPLFIDTLLPDFAMVGVRALPWLEIFARAELAGGRWHVQTEGSIPDHFIKHIDGRAGAGLTFKLPGRYRFGRPALRVWGGVNPYRRLEVRDKEELDTHIDASLEVGPMVAASLLLVPIPRPPDRDRDGIPDERDQCPDQPEDKDGYQDRDGCPDDDNDGDGIADGDDRCPDRAEDKDGFEDEDGCPDHDNDDDGIADRDDKCPDEPETYNGHEDSDGCPDKARVIVRAKRIELDDKIYFETDRAVIKEVSWGLLAALAAAIKGHPKLRLIEIQGHADERGSEQHNLQLSQARANAVRDLLIHYGVKGERLRARGFGRSRPLVEGHDEAAWAKNRRVEFHIIEQGGGSTPSSDNPNGKR